MFNNEFILQSFNSIYTVPCLIILFILQDVKYKLQLPVMFNVVIDNPANLTEDEADVMFNWVIDKRPPFSYPKLEIVIFCLEHVIIIYPRKNY